MPSLPGWVSLLSDLEKPFEELFSSKVTLALYVAANHEVLFSGMPSQLRQGIRDKQIVSQGIGSCDAIYPTFSWWCLFVNPSPPNEAYLEHVVYPKRDRFNELAADAWSILPSHIRLLARGANGPIGWLFVVYHILKEADVGAVTLNSTMATISIDVARASHLAIREIVRKYSASGEESGSMNSERGLDDSYLSHFGLSPYTVPTMSDYGLHWDNNFTDIESKDDKSVEPEGELDPSRHYTLGKLENDLHNFAYRQNVFFLAVEKEGLIVGKHTLATAAIEATNAQDCLNRIAGINELRAICKDLWDNDLALTTCRKLRALLVRINPEITIPIANEMRVSEVAEIIRKASLPPNSQVPDDSSIHSTIDALLEYVSQLPDVVSKYFHTLYRKDIKLIAESIERKISRLCGDLKCLSPSLLTSDRWHEFVSSVNDIEADCKAIIAPLDSLDPSLIFNSGEQGTEYANRLNLAVDSLQSNKFRMKESWNRLRLFGEEFKRVPGPKALEIRNQNRDFNMPNNPPLASSPLTKVFFSYSHKDKRWLEKFKKALKPSIDADMLWDDSKIQAGQKWRDEIRQALTTAKVAVLLVSIDFLNSDFIAKHELPPLLEAAEREGLKILWIPVGHSMYHETEIASYQATHDPAQPLNSLKGPKQEKAIIEICMKIKRSIEPPAE